MADYQETLAKIRTARKTRDDARTELHASLVEGLTLDRRIARAGRDDIDRHDQDDGHVARRDPAAVMTNASAQMGAKRRQDGSSLRHGKIRDPHRASFSRTAIRNL